jgi:hypothetical protein
VRTAAGAVRVLGTKFRIDVLGGLEDRVMKRLLAGTVAGAGSALIVVAVVQGSVRFANENGGVRLRESDVAAAAPGARPRRLSEGQIRKLEEERDRLLTARDRLRDQGKAPVPAIEPSEREVRADFDEYLGLLRTGPATRDRTRYAELFTRLKRLVYASKTARDVYLGLVTAESSPSVLRSLVILAQPSSSYNARSGSYFRGGIPPEGSTNPELGRAILGLMDRTPEPRRRRALFGVFYDPVHSGAGLSDVRGWKLDDDLKRFAEKETDPAILLPILSHLERSEKLLGSRPDLLQRLLDWGRYWQPDPDPEYEQAERGQFLQGLTEGLTRALGPDRTVEAIASMKSSFRDPEEQTRRRPKARPPGPATAPPPAM